MEEMVPLWHQVHWKKKKKKIKIFTALKHNKPDLSAFQLQSVRNNPTEVSLNET